MIKLNDDELMMLEALVQGPAYSLIRKIADDYKEEVKASLLNAKDMPEVFKFQGRVAGVEAVYNLMGFYATQSKAKREAAMKAASK